MGIALAQGDEGDEDGGVARRLKGAGKYKRASERASEREGRLSCKLPKGVSVRLCRGRLRQGGAYGLPGVGFPDFS